MAHLVSPLQRSDEQDQGNFSDLTKAQTAWLRPFRLVIFDGCCEKSARHVAALWLDHSTPDKAK